MHALYPALVPETTTCDSCGREEPAEDLLAVHRVYVTPGGPGDDGGPTERLEVVADLERWCFPCRSSYPHQVEGAPEPEL